MPSLKTEWRGDRIHFPALFPQNGAPALTFSVQTRQKVSSNIQLCVVLNTQVLFSMTSCWQTCKFVQWHISIVSAAVYLIGFVPLHIMSSILYGAEAVRRLQQIWMEPDGKSGEVSSLESYVVLLKRLRKLETWKMNTIQASGSTKLILKRPLRLFSKSKSLVLAANAETCLFSEHCEDHSRDHTEKSDNVSSNQTGNSGLLEARRPEPFFMFLFQLFLLLLPFFFFLTIQEDAAATSLRD